jgi:ABC-type transport system involved in multi-copper enzyme maturation permease subunit
MMSMWLRQLWAVFRLEVGKSFFSRRGLWIYVLALMPVLIFLGHAYVVKRDASRRSGVASEGVTHEKLHSIRRGMLKEQVLERLPNPYNQRSFETRGGLREFMQYSSKDEDLTVRLLDGKVVSIQFRGECNLERDQIIFATVYQLFFLRLAVFFGCVFVFLNLFRGEVLDKSLHYYFLAPVRREIVVLGKYLAGLVATSVIFAVSAALQMTVLFLHFPKAILDEYLNTGHGWEHAFAYIGVAALACVGYGSVFLLAGMMMRNPLIPAVSILMWESINSILPAVLRKISVIYYLKSMCPVEILSKQDVPPVLALLAVNVEPATPLVAIGGLCAVALGFVAIAAYYSRRMEINYASE